MLSVWKTETIGSPAMNQNKVIEGLSNWLRSEQLSELCRVRCDHVTHDRETLGLYLSSKISGSGRSDQIAQVDVVVTDEVSKRVELVIEVDPNPNPKKLLGNVLSVSLADNYTPSNSNQAYRIEGTVVIFVTLLDLKSGSQKAEQLRRLEVALNTRLDLKRMGVRSVRLCYGSSEDEAETHAREVIMRELAKPTSTQILP